MKSLIMFNISLILICLFFHSVFGSGLSFDPDNFLCTNYDEFCYTAMEGLGCSNGEIWSIGCPDYPSVSNDISKFVGICQCNDTSLTIPDGGDIVTRTIIDNRVKKTMSYVLEPWDTGPPYNYEISYSAICNLVLNRLGCSGDDMTVTPASSVCSCGTMTLANTHIDELILNQINSFNYNTFPVFEDPVTLSLPLSIALVLITGKIFSILSAYLSLPPIIGFLLGGIAIQNYLDRSFLQSDELRKIALTIVLMRAGLAVKLKEIYRNKIATVTLSLLPYCAEFMSWFLISRALQHALGESFLFYNWSTTELGLMASVLTPLGPSAIITQCLAAIARQDQDHGFLPKQAVITAPFEAIIAILLFDLFSKLNDSTTVTRLYPWVEEQPLWVNIIMIIVNILFSAAMGMIIGRVCAWYIDWRAEIKTDFLWVQLNKNPQMGSNTADLVFVILGAAYMMMSLCVPRYIQYSTGILVVYVSCITLHYCVQDKRLIADIAGGLRSVWVFAEVFLNTLLGASLAFNHNNGPLPSDRGLSSNSMGQLTLLMVISLTCRFVGVVVGIVGMLYWWMPEHRRTFPFLWRHIVGTFILQIPRTTIQATLGPVAYHSNIIPGIDGLNKGFIINQCAAYVVLIFAPLGTFLSKHVSFSLALEMTDMDSLAHYNHKKFRYRTLSETHKRHSYNKKQGHKTPKNDNKDGAASPDSSAKSMKLTISVSSDEYDDQDPNVTADEDDSDSDASTESSASEEELSKEVRKEMQAEEVRRQARMKRAATIFDTIKNITPTTHAGPRSVGRDSPAFRRRSQSFGSIYSGSSSPSLSPTSRSPDDRFTPRPGQLGGTKITHSGTSTKSEPGELLQRSRGISLDPQYIEMNIGTPTIRPFQQNSDYDKESEKETTEA